MTVNPVKTLTGTESPSVPQLFMARVEQTPDATFLVHEGTSWTYADALGEIRAVAGWLAATAGAPRRAATFLHNRPEAMWAWLGTLHSGATHVSLHRGHRGAVLADMISRSGAEVIFTDAAGLKDLPGLTGTGIRTVVVADPMPPSERREGIRLAGWDEVASSRPVDARSDGSSIAGVIYTSGTTGRSKAVPQPHTCLSRGAGWVTRTVELGASDVMHLWLPLYHVAGQLDTTLAFVVAGGSVALYPRFSRSLFWQQVEESGATVFGGFSNILEMLYSNPAPDGGGTLRAGIVGGIPPDLHRPFEQQFDLRLYDVYGMTESDPMLIAAPGEIAPAGSCGRPNPDFDVALLNENDAPVTRGSAGEIAVRPRMDGVLTPGYEGDDEAWREATHGGWFHTGDLGRQDEDGFFFFLDRRKHALRRRGENISSWELEQIIGTHPSVEECCVVAVAGANNEDDIKVVVAPVAGNQIDPGELRSWCAENMAAFMLPRYVEILEELPRNAVGKPAKTELGGVGGGVWDLQLVENPRR